MHSWVDNDVYEDVFDVDGVWPISLRWVLTEKEEDGAKFHKARLVARGFEEDTSDLVTRSTTVSRDSTRGFLAMLASYRWKPSSMDVKTAFLQGKDIERDVFVKPPIEARQGATHLWRLKKAIYGLGDASRNLFDTIKNFFLEEGGQAHVLDECAFVWLDKNDNALGIVIIHVDDIAYGGSKDFLGIMQRLRERFLIGKEKEGDFVFLGMQVSTHTNGNLSLIHI